MAKAILRVGVETDVTGMRRLGQQANAQLEALRGGVNRMGALMAASMAMPLVGFAQQMIEQREELRRQGRDLATPFSPEIQGAEQEAAQDDIRLGQKLAESYGPKIAERIAREQDIKEAKITGAMSKTDFETGITSFFKNIDQLGSLVASNIQQIYDVGTGMDPKSYQNQRYNLEQERSLAILTGQGNIGQLNAMIERLDRLINNTQGAR
jgi:hypothetical protein